MPNCLRGAKASVPFLTLKTEPAYETFYNLFSSPRQETIPPPSKKEHRVDTPSLKA
jgi:hypothetical protein